MVLEIVDRRFCFMRFTQYIKTAFLNRWNLLAFLAGSAFAVVSGVPDVVFPLVLAGEIGYLGLLAAHPRFQAYVDAQDAKEAREQGAISNQQSVESILRTLPPRSVDRYEALRARCQEVWQIGEALKRSSLSGPTVLEETHLASLNRLLWMYLRVLHTQYSLERFLQKTNPGQIERDISVLEARLQETQKIADADQRERFAKTIADNIQTSRDRLASYHKARADFDFWQLEIDRLENKIKSLSEMVVNRQEPDFISGQIDQAVSSLKQTERTMNELQFATGLSTVDETVPELLRPPVATVREQ